MDITPTTTVLPLNTHETTPPAKSPEHEPETPTRFQPAQQQPVKQGSFSNGVLRRHQVNHHHHHPFHHHIPIVVTYKECLKNHAASMGGHALDGCGEFMPSPSATHTDPTSLKCAACGCHRNFHRRDSDDHYATSSPPQPPTPTLLPPNATATLEFQPQNRHHPPAPHQQPPQPNQSPNSSSPPPISSSYYPSAHVLLALSTGAELPNLNGAANTSPRKRFRTKFTPVQKDKMFKFAEKVGWKMQKRDEDLIQRFCNEVKVDKSVLKVWMHNNKNTFGKRVLDGALDGVVSSSPPGGGSPNGTAVIQDIEDDEDLSIEQRHIPFTAAPPAVNGGSPSSS